MPDGIDPSDGSFSAPGQGFDFFTDVFPFIFGGLFLLIVVFFVFVIVRIVKNRKVYAKYEQDVLKLPGAILAAVERGDTQGAQLLQQQLAMSQALMTRRGGIAAAGATDLGLNNPGMLNGQPLGMQDFNGDGIPGN